MVKEVSFLETDDVYEIVDKDCRDKLKNKTNIDEINQKRMQGHFDTYGMFEKGVCISSITNTDERPGVMGFLTPQQALDYSTRDSVGFFAYGTPPHDYKVDTTNTTFANKYVTVTDQLQNIDYKDTIVEVFLGSERKYFGFVTSVDIEAKKINVDSWYQYGEPYTNTYVPPNGSRVVIGYANAIWGANIIARLSKLYDADIGYGAEIELRTDKAMATGAGLLLLLNSLGTANKIPSGLLITGKDGKDYNVALDIIEPNTTVLSAKIEKATNKFLLYLVDTLTDTLTYFIDTQGKQSKLAILEQVLGAPTEPISDQASHIIFNFSSEQTYNFPAPSQTQGKIFFITNNTLNTVHLNLTTKTHDLVGSGTCILLSNGSSYSIFGG